MDIDVNTIVKISIPGITQALGASVIIDLDLLTILDLIESGSI